MQDLVVPERSSVAVRRRSPSVAQPWALILTAGVAALVLPTFVGIAQVSWSTEQGAHGPIVLAVGLWLLARRWPALRADAVPGRAALGWPILMLGLAGYVVARVVGSIVIESAMLYVALVAALYLFVGGAALRANGFPVAYLLLALPPPGGWVAAATQPLRLEIAHAAADGLAALGYPVAHAGLLIFVDHYVLEVKAACGGLNSIVSLAALGLFYAYVRHRADVRYMALLFAVAVVLAIVSNFVRVVALVLVTHYLGNGAAQGFLHDFAGLTMFAVAMGGVLLFDRLAAPLLAARSRA